MGCCFLSVVRNCSNPELTKRSSFQSRACGGLHCVACQRATINVKDSGAPKWMVMISWAFGLTRNCAHAYRRNTVMTCQKTGAKDDGKGQSRRIHDNLQQAYLLRGPMDLIGHALPPHPKPKLLQKVQCTATAAAG